MLKRHRVKLVVLNHDYKSEDLAAARSVCKALDKPTNPGKK